LNSLRQPPASPAQIAKGTKSMTAPAAALIQRLLPKRESVREAGQAATPAQNPALNRAQNPALSPGPYPPANGGFAAYLERRSAHPSADQPSSAGTPANETSAVEPALVSAATATGAPSGTPPAVSSDCPPAVPSAAQLLDAATGKALPLNRQMPSHPPAQAVLVMLNARGAAVADDADVDAAKPEAKTEAAETTGSASPAVLSLFPAQLSAPAIPAPVVPQRAAAPAKAAPSASRGAAPPLTPARAAIAPVAGTAAPAVSSTPEAAPTASALIAVPAVAFVLERDGPVACPPDSAEAASPDAPPPAADQTAVKAQPSTLAALTGPATPDRPALRKARAETEAALPGPKSNAAEMTASAFSLAQPPAGFASAVSASAEPAASGQPTDGIGFDALVDSIARARDGAAVGAPVAIAMHHVEFGRVSLRFQSDADGLSVAMTSPDPAFAPAVAAAHAAEAASAASVDPPPRTSQASNTSSPASYSSGGQMQDGARSGTGQRQDSPQQPRVTAEPSRTAPLRRETSTDDRRGGIFA